MKKIKIDRAIQERPATRKQTRNEKIRQSLTEHVDVQVIPAITDREGYEKPKLRVCAYCRVSTDMDTQALSYELQVQNYTDYIRGNNEWQFAGIYADRGISGTSLKHRDEFNRMIEDCKAGKIDLIITKAVTRFARNVLDCISTIRMLKQLEHPVAVYFETERINTLDTETVNLAELFSEELDGLRPSFERIKIPAGGGLAYEVPGDDPNSPDSAKDFSAVILYHHPINSYYKEKFTGGNNPPDCSSLDGKLGIVAETGECKECKTCPYAKFGSGENGGMACKQKRRMYLLREGEMLPMIMTLPTGSLAEFTKYVTRLVTRGMKANHVVTKFTLKRAQNSTGINYSQVICSVDRPLSPEEKKNIASMTEQVKLIAGKVSVAETETAAE